MIRRLWRQFGGWLRKFRFRQTPRPYELLFLEADELPQELPFRTLLVAREGSELWTAGMVCPCGCGRRIELMLLEEVKPRWDLVVERSGNPSLKPSVWVKDGCRSHFWLRDGQVHWCRN